MKKSIPGYYAEFKFPNYHRRAFQLSLKNRTRIKISVIRKFMRSIEYLPLAISMYLCMTAALVAADAVITDDAGANAVNSSLRSQSNDKNQSEIVGIAAMILFSPTLIDQAKNR